MNDGRLTGGIPYIDGKKNNSSTDIIKVELRYLKESINDFISDYKEASKKQDNNIKDNEKDISELRTAFEIFKEQQKTIENERERQNKMRMAWITAIFAAMQGIGALLVILL